MDKDLVDACQMFLIPVTILFAALGASSTDQLKTLISLMGVITSGLWFYRLLVWPALNWNDRFVVIALASLFTAAWVISTAAHARLWASRSGG